LVGGADVFGLKEGISANDSYFDDVRANAPVGAVAAIMRRSDGPSAGEKYYLRDLLMMVNLTDGALSNPMLGVGTSGSDFERPLLEQGFARNPLFGGSGPVTLGSLPAFGVYATMVDLGLGLEVNASVGGSAGLEGLSFDALDVEYILSTSLPGDFDFDGDVDGRDFLKWQRNPSIGDLSDWQNNYGTGALTANSTAVPEPGCLMMVLAFVAVIPAPLRCATCRG
jgi:hypothetical protein